MEKTNHVGVNVSVGSGKNDEDNQDEMDDDENDVQIVEVVGGSNTRKNATETSNNIDVSAIQEFKHRNHSLSINASSVAACVGYHEFQSIPELMLRHVYQGRRGQRLLEHDARLLGLELAAPEDDEVELIRLAESTGSSGVVSAMTRALKVKHGDREEQQKLRSVDDARALKKTVTDLEAADVKKRLTPHQLRVLKEGMRQAVDTGCGNSWEEEALDQYQEQCGWEVRERNAECRLWHFEKTDGDDTDLGDDIIIINENGDGTPSIRPIAPAYARCRENIADRSSANDHNQYNNHNYDARGVKRKFPSSHDSQISETALMEFSPHARLDFGSGSSHINCSSKGKEETKATDKESSSAGVAKNALADVIRIDEQNNVHTSRHNNGRPQNVSRRPFVTIKGMVDGIRDELGPTRGTPVEWRKVEEKNVQEKDDDDLSCDSFSLSRVVVECKHRMRALLPNGPRFSECIQAVVYCFMYETNDADIIQVLRSTTQTANIEIKNDNDNRKHSGPLLTDYFHKTSPKNAKALDTIENNNEDADKKGTNNTADEEIVDAKTNKLKTMAGKKIEDVEEKKNNNRSDVTMQIAVDRVWLDDPRFDHRANWKAVILPKLRRWVDAVYRIRQSDDKRYRLLTALSNIAADDSLVGNEQEMQQTRRDHARAAWEIVFEECDFLREGMSGERYRIETQ